VPGRYANKRDHYVVLQMDQTGGRNRWVDHYGPFSTRAEADKVRQDQSAHYLAAYTNKFAEQYEEESLARGWGWRRSQYYFRVELISDLLRTQEGRRTLRWVGLPPEEFKR